MHRETGGKWEKERQAEEEEEEEDIMELFSNFPNV